MVSMFQKGTIQVSQKNDNNQNIGSMEMNSDFWVGETEINVKIKYKCNERSWNIFCSGYLCSFFLRYKCLKWSCSSHPKEKMRVFVSLFSYFHNIIIYKFVSFSSVEFLSFGYFFIVRPRVYIWFRLFIELAYTMICRWANELKRIYTDETEKRKSNVIAFFTKI